MYYIANIRLPTEKAHGIQIMKMCEAFALSGESITLLLPKRRNVIKDNPFAYYKVQDIFSIKYLPTLDLVRFGSIGFRIQSFTFALSVLFYSLFILKGNKESVFYGRDELPLVLLTSFNKKVVWETHMGHLNFFIQLLISRRIKTIAITNGLKNFYVEKGVASKDIFVAPDGVDLEQFNISVSTRDARKRIGLPLDQIIILYTGHLYEWKGADTLARAAALIPSKIQVIFVGGTDKHVEDFKERYGGLDNVFILGRKPHHEIPLYLKSADVLVIPNSAKEEISRSYTSPMKLFEYMASGVPIIASDLPSLREILNNDNAYFFKPDDAKSLAEIIKKVLVEKDERMIKAKRTKEKVQNYSWLNRSEYILNFIQN